MRSSYSFRTAARSAGSSRCSSSSVSCLTSNVSPENLTRRETEISRLTRLRSSGSRTFKASSWPKPIPFLNCSSAAWPCRTKASSLLRSTSLSSISFRVASSRPMTWLSWPTPIRSKLARDLDPLRDEALVILERELGLDRLAQLGRQAAEERLARDAQTGERLDLLDHRLDDRRVDDLARMRRGAPGDGRLGQEAEAAALTLPDRAEARRGTLSRRRFGCALRSFRRSTPGSGQQLPCRGCTASIPARAAKCRLWSAFRTEVRVHVRYTARRSFSTERTNDSPRLSLARRLLSPPRQRGESFMKATLSTLSLVSVFGWAATRPRRRRPGAPGSAAIASIPAAASSTRSTTPTRAMH